MLKRLSSFFVSVFLLVSMFELVATRPALGYIDAESTSLILQFLAAGVLAGLFSVNLFWRQILDGISNLKVKVDQSKSGSHVY